MLLALLALAFGVQKSYSGVYIYIVSTRGVSRGGRVSLESRVAGTARVRSQEARPKRLQSK